MDPETPLPERLWSGDDEYGHQVTSSAGARLLCVKGVARGVYAELEERRRSSWPDPGLRPVAGSYRLRLG